MDGITWFGIALVALALVLSIRRDLKHAKALNSVEDELQRWRATTDEARRWLAEFPDVAIALDHVMRCAAGVENPEFISNVRDAMRAQRDHVVGFSEFNKQMLDNMTKVMGVPAEIMRGREFGVAYQHLSAECCGDDTPSKPSRWDGAMRGL